MFSKRRDAGPRGASSSFQSVRWVVLWGLVTDQSVFPGKVLHDNLRDNQEMVALLCVRRLGLSLDEAGVKMCLERGIGPAVGCFRSGR